MITRNVNCLVLLLFISLSCNRVKQQFDDGGANDLEEKVKVQKRIFNDFKEPNDRVKTFLEADLDKDDHLDSLFLSVNAEIDDKRRIIWDDAPRWTVYIKNSKYSKKIYQNTIQLGKLMLYFDRNQKQIYIVEDAPYQKKKYKVDFRRDFTLVETEELPRNQKFEILDFE